VTRAPRAALIATGDELVGGAFVDTNSGALARRLAQCGWETTRCIVLGDDEDLLTATLRELAPAHDAVVITGGLGPTLDDVTRHAAARAAGVELALDARVLAELQALFATRQRPFPPSNERQALFPAGAEVLANPQGTAPGFALTLGACLVCALPGPPREMLPMLERELVPRLARHRPPSSGLAQRALYLVGLPEGVFAEQCGAAMRRDANPLVGVTAKNSVLSVSVRARAASVPEAEALAERHADELARRFHAHVYSRDEPDLAQVLGRELLARRIAVTCAESCTGGLLAARLTQVAGISAVFERSFVTYADRAKTEELGVDPALLARHGAVSAEVAAALALGAARRAGARLALSITGIAGPAGATADKPVGLVWLGRAFDGAVVTEQRRFLALGRDLVREFAVTAALDLGLRALVPRPH